MQDKPKVLICQRPTCDNTVHIELAEQRGWFVIEDMRGTVRGWCPEHGGKTP